MRGVTKSFGAVRALDGVDLEVGAGEVHALVGENGAGKSTLMKVLSGAHAPDGGTLTWRGEPYHPKDPRDALERGVAMIYQELNLAPHLTVTENVLLGREPHRLGFLNRREMKRRVQAVLERLEHPDLDPDARVADLSPGPRQLVEVARALVEDASLLVMDEPTSSLARDDVARLFGLIRGLRGDGVSVIYISHFLEEVREVCDRFTVLRDGATVATGRVADVEDRELIQAMVGRELDEVYPRVPHRAGEVVLSVRGLRGMPAPRGVDLDLHRGEVFGIAGLVGAGRTEFLRCLYGLDEVRSGSVRIGSIEGATATPAERIRAGVGLLSEDRKDEGLALARSLAENMTLSNPAPFQRLGWMSLARRRSQSQAWLDRLAVRCTGPDQRAGDLSGGNQQKVAFARLLHQGADVLLLDEPTRGVDVASKVEIYRWIGELAAEGRAVLMSSSYLPELLGTCDRIAVMHRGVLGPARPTAEWDEHSLLEAASRGEATA